MCWSPCGLNTPPRVKQPHFTSTNCLSPGHYLLISNGDFKRPLPNALNSPHLQNSGGFSNSFCGSYGAIPEVPGSLLLTLHVDRIAALTPVCVCSRRTIGSNCLAAIRVIIGDGYVYIAEQAWEDKVVLWRYGDTRGRGLSGPPRGGSNSTYRDLSFFVLTSPVSALGRVVYLFRPSFVVGGRVC